MLNLEQTPQMEGDGRQEQGAQDPTTESHLPEGFVEALKELVVGQIDELEGRLKPRQDFTAVRHDYLEGFEVPGLVTVYTSGSNYPEGTVYRSIYYHGNHARLIMEIGQKNELRRLDLALPITSRENPQSIIVFLTATKFYDKVTIEERVPDLKLSHPYILDPSDPRAHQELTIKPSNTLYLMGYPLVQKELAELLKNLGLEFQTDALSLKDAIIQAIFPPAVFHTETNVFQGSLISQLLGAHFELQITNTYRDSRITDRTITFLDPEVNVRFRIRHDYGRDPVIEL